MSANNTACQNPALCGVKTHRPGTIAKCATAKAGKFGSGAGVWGGAPKLATGSAATPERFVEMDTYKAEDQEELTRLLNSGESQIEGCTENELAVLSKMSRFEFMDSGIQTGLTWNFAFNDGVQEACKVPRSSVPGIVGSLIKKDYLYSEGTGSEDCIHIRPKGVAAHFEINPDGYGEVWSRN